MNKKTPRSAHLKHFATATKLFLVAFFLLNLTDATAQRLQIQAQAGTNFSKGRIQDIETGYVSRETSTYFDTLPVQLGLGIKIKAFRHFYVRVDGSYKAYRTYFHAEQQDGNVPKYILGNLYNEKYTWSLLPEFQYTLISGKRFELPAYVFTGPVLSFEKEKNFSYNYLISNGLSAIENAIEPDSQTGWSFGLGFNPKWRRLGLLLEGRLLRIGYQDEGALVGRIAYQHFTIMSGITYDLF
ncbi:MAG: hypothetical protein JNM22_09240 [Saprospiraceae bacterium]|nr:hypothetical protein [Saprospiraceae bacterium]